MRLIAPKRRFKKNKTATIIFINSCRKSLQLYTHNDQNYTKITEIQKYICISINIMYNEDIFNIYYIGDVLLRHLLP